MTQSVERSTTRVITFHGNCGVRSPDRLASGRQGESRHERHGSDAQRGLRVASVGLRAPQLTSQAGLLSCASMTFGSRAWRSSFQEPYRRGRLPEGRVFAGALAFRKVAVNSRRRRSFGRGISPTDSTSLSAART